jgi:hypothetical protein
MTRLAENLAHTLHQAGLRSIDLRKENAMSLVHQIATLTAERERLKIQLEGLTEAAEREIADLRAQIAALKADRQRYIQTTVDRVAA